MAHLRVLQTSDLHNHIDLRKAGRLRHLRLEHQAILVDCGDAIWAGNVFVKPGPEQAIRRMNEAGYDAMAMGNREYFFRSFGLLMKTAEAKFPVLSANLLAASGTLGHVKRWTVVELPGGDSVGLFGLTPLMIPPKSWGESLSDMRFISHSRATKEALAALRGRCRWIVCLSHAGFERDCELAGEFGEIDLILGGHSHLETDDVLVVNGVTVSHIGPHGKYAALLTGGRDDRSAIFTRQMIHIEDTGDERP